MTRLVERHAELGEGGRPDAASTPAGSRPDGAGSGRSSLLRLVLVVALVVAVAVLLHGGDLVVVVAAVILMITVHELGHFVTAKWSGMKVTEAFLGFGPRLWSIRRGETEYGIKAIPAGAYVKIIGMSNLEAVDPADEPRTYRQQPFHNRLLVALAGSGAQLLLAVVALWAFVAAVGVPNPDVVQVTGLAPLAHGADPARVAGLRAGDVLTGADGMTLAPRGHDGSSTQTLVDIVGAHAGRPLALRVERHGTMRTVVVVPEPVKTTSGGKTTTVGRIGVAIGSGPDQAVNPVRAVGTAANWFGQVVTGTVGGFQRTFSAHGLSSLFTQLGNSKAAAQAARTGDRPESIYGAIHLATEGAQAGPAALLAVLVAIDVSVALLNLFPMLPLDGGHVLVAVYERVRSRRGRRYTADVAKLTPVAYVFLLFLVIFVCSVLFLDITHPVANPFG